MNNSNTNIQERLQVLHDYIQRTIDALNDLGSSTRQVMHGLGATPRTDVNANVGVGLSHSSLPIQGQTPFGWAPYGVQNQFGTPMMFPMGTIGLNHTGVPSYSVVQTPYGLMQIPSQSFLQPHSATVGGLNHSTFVPGQGWVLQGQVGVPVVSPQYVPQQLGLGYQGWQGGLNHTSFSPMTSFINTPFSTPMHTVGQFGQINRVPVFGNSVG
jgi:hypothetical protein